MANQPAKTICGDCLKPCADNIPRGYRTADECRCRSRSDFGDDTIISIDYTAVEERVFSDYDQHFGNFTEPSNHSPTGRVRRQEPAFYGINRRGAVRRSLKD